MTNDVQRQGWRYKGMKRNMVAMVALVCATVPGQDGLFMSGAEGGA